MSTPCACTCSAPAVPASAAPPAAALSLRDQFAMHALTGLLENKEIYPWDQVDGGLKVGTYARLSYQLADAMVAERSKQVRSR